MIIRNLRCKRCRGNMTLGEYPEGFEIKCLMCSRIENDNIPNFIKEIMDRRQIGSKLCKI